MLTSDDNSEQLKGEGGKGALLLVASLFSLLLLRFVPLGFGFERAAELLPKPGHATRAQPRDTDRSWRAMGWRVQTPHGRIKPVRQLRRTAPGRRAGASAVRVTKPGASKPWMARRRAQRVQDAQRCAAGAARKRSTRMCWRAVDIAPIRRAGRRPAHKACCGLAHAACLQPYVRGDGQFG